MPFYLTFALISTNRKKISRDPLSLDCDKKGHQFKIGGTSSRHHKKIPSDVPL